MLSRGSWQLRRPTNDRWSFHTDFHCRWSCSCSSPSPLIALAWLLPRFPIVYFNTRQWRWMVAILPMVCTLTSFSGTPHPFTPHCRPESSINLIWHASSRHHYLWSSSILYVSSLNIVLTNTNVVWCKQPSPSLPLSRLHPTFLARWYHYNLPASIAY